MQDMNNLEFDILIIDNREVSRNTTYNILSNSGYKVDTALHGKDGILKLKENKFLYKLVITEMIMPYASGFEVIESVKNNSKIPVMVLSSVNDENTITSIYDLGTDEFVKKPFIISEFLQKVKRLIATRNNLMIAPVLMSPSPDLGNSAMSNSAASLNKISTAPIKQTKITRTKKVEKTEDIVIPIKTRKPKSESGPSTIKATNAGIPKNIVVKKATKSISTNSTTKNAKAKTTAEQENIVAKKKEEKAVAPAKRKITQTLKATTINVKKGKEVGLKKNAKTDFQETKKRKTV